MLSLIASRSGSGLGNGLIGFLNPYSYLLMRTERKLLAQFDSIFFDGVALALLMRTIGVRCTRTSFDSTSLAPQVFVACVERGLTVYLIGGEPGVVEAATEVFRKDYPGLNIVGHRHGYFASSFERDEVIREIVDFKPGIVVAGMGTPLQERFLVDVRAAGWNGTGYTCGGFFHQTARRGARYYPRWIDKLNIRFAFRMWDEPKLVRRYLVDYPKFLFWFFVDLGVLVIRRLIGRNASRSRGSAGS